MIINIGFNIGDEVWIINSKPNPIYSKFYPLLYGSSEKDTGFAVTVITNEGNKVQICRSNCFHTKQECQLTCDELNNRFKK